MRKIFILFITIAIIIFSGCESDIDRQLNEAREAERNAQEKLEEQQNEMDRLEYLIDRYSELQIEIENAQEGTEKYKDLIEENNRIVRTLMEEFPEIKDYVSVS